MQIAAQLLATALGKRANELTCDVLIVHTVSSSNLAALLAKIEPYLNSIVISQTEPAIQPAAYVQLLRNEEFC